jgi:hypothetical protein
VIKTPFDIHETILLGNDLRVLLNSDHISYGEVHATLKEKGIFVGDSEKTVTVPLLCATLLTPGNFSRLLETATSRESQPKIKVSNLKLVGSSVKWSEPLREELFAEGFNCIGDIPNVEIQEPPEIVVEGKNKIKIPYTIRRSDYSKDWLQRELKFEGEIRIKQADDGLQLEFFTTHTSKETEIINKKIEDRICKLLKQANVTVTDEPQKITFGEFSNQERVRFFKRLTAGKALSTGSVNEIEIRLDATSGALPNDQRIAWMKDAVRRLKVDGDRLNDVFLISDEGCYSYYFIYKMDVTYAYTFGANAGTCQVSFSFSSPGRSESIRNEAELIYTIVQTRYNDTVNADSKRTIYHALNQALRQVVEEKHKQMLKESAA